MGAPAVIVKRVSAFLVVLLISATFFELGLWQWHRAQAVQRQSVTPPERAVVDLEGVAAAGHNLRDAAYNRLVTFSGKYVKFYIAPKQVLSDKRVVDLEVGLMELSRNRAILVVRGLNNGSLAESADQITVMGRLYPHQNEDHADTTTTTLSRLDPALVAGVGNYHLFDGYVSAISEKSLTGEAISGSRIPAPALINPIGGFYWQHIAYVITWWFMAILVLFAPFYNRSLNRAKQIG
jgi:surfeit locus 1 family protein